MKKKIVIGDRVWICAGAFIGPGVNVGDEAVIAAHAVVTNNVEKRVIAAGNPAKTIKNRVIKPNT